jgi:hypothetical protein
MNARDDGLAARGLQGCESCRVAMVFVSMSSRASRIAAPPLPQLTASPCRSELARDKVGTTFRQFHDNREINRPAL